MWPLASAVRDSFLLDTWACLRGLTGLILLTGVDHAPTNKLDNLAHYFFRKIIWPIVLRVYKYAVFDRLG
jgi:hypothetical protein